MIGWIVVGFGAVSAGAFLASRLSRYRAVFSDDSFLEVAQACPRLKTAALDQPIGGDMSGLRPGDPRTLVTSSGLGLVYTVRRDDDAYIHHCSVSFRGSYTAHAVGATFTLLLVKLLGVPLDHAQFAVGKSTVHHMEARLGPADHAALAARPVPAVSAGDLAALRDELLALRSRTSWQRL